LDDVGDALRIMDVVSHCGPDGTDVGPIQRRERVHVARPDGRDEGCVLCSPLERRSHPDHAATVRRERYVARAKMRPR
jgi:hypothetical protein